MIDTNRSNRPSTILYQDVYGVASLMSKNDAEKIYNASRRSDVSLEMADILLEDYDHSTQILTANEAIWRRLNTISHYGITDGAILYLSFRSSSSSSSKSSHGEHNSLLNGGVESNVKRFPVNNGTKLNNNRFLQTTYNHDGSNVISETYGSSIANDNNDDNTEYHLYEQIPADRNSNRDTFYGYTGANNDDNNVYNLSQTSFTRMTPMINYNNYESSQQRYEPYVYQRPPSTLRSEEMYGIGNVRTVGNTSLTYQTVSNSMLNNSPFSPNHSRLLLQPNQSLSSYRLNSIANNRRSFARNVYDRLSLFVKRTSSKRQQRRINHTLHNNNKRMMANQRRFNF
ncbi:hypothetical protein BLA29_005580, partial [Euroglyphus maynei]